MTSGGIRRSFTAWAALALASFGGVVHANPEPYQLNLTRGATTWSQVPYNLNTISLGICVVIGILVFGAMFIAMFRFRKSRGAVAEKWAHNTTLEVVWTTIPVLILITLAYLATTQTRRSRPGAALPPVPASSGSGALLAVCFDEALDKLVDIARLG